MSTTQSSTIVQRVWNYCNVLRDDGMSYGDQLCRIAVGGDARVQAAADGALREGWDNV